MGERVTKHHFSLVALLLLVSPGIVTASTGRCTGTLGKGADVLAAAAHAARARCEDAKLRGRLAPDVDCASHPSTAKTNAKAAERVGRKIARVCGGGDRRCGTGDDEALAAIGWNVATCPGILGDDPTHCRDPIDDCGSVARCLACMAVETAGGVSSYYAALAPSDDPAVARCQVAVGRAATKLASAQSDKKRKRALASVCKACGGRDRHCDGTDDVAGNAIAFAGECPGVTGPTGRSCGGTVAGPEDVTACAECLAAARSECVAESLAPSDQPQPEECTACCGPHRMVLESIAGGSFAFGAIAPFELPAGIRLTLDVGPPDDTCRHDVIVPAGGLEFPPFCLGPFPYTGDLLPTGCPIGGALGRGVMWDGRALSADADLTIEGDTSDGLCNPLAQQCALQELEAGSNFLGRLTATESTSPARGLHLRLDLPARTISWEDAQGQCPDDDGVRDEGDQTVTDDRQVAHFTTGTSTVRFTDLDGDQCAYTGLGPATAIVREGAPGGQACCTPGERVTLVATSPVFTGSSPFGDLATSLSIPFQVVSCEPWPGAANETCEALAGGGRVVTKLAAKEDSPTAVAIQDDGKIVAAGHTNDGKTGNTIALVRYLEDGSLDTAFGSTGDGRVRTKIGHDDRAQALAIDAGGKLLVSGYSSTTDGSPKQLLIAGYLPGGSLDASFDGDGVLVSPLGGVDDRGEAIAIDPLGRIVVAGRTSNGTDFDVFVARFEPNGMPDLDFGSSGVASFVLGGSDEIPAGLAIQDDGKLLIGMRVGEPPAPRHAVVLRLLGDGSPDLVFGTNGIASIDVASPDYWINDLALQSDGRIVIAGAAILPGTSHLLLGRLVDGGDPDPTFGDGGIVAIETAPQQDSRDVLVAGDGRIVIAGWSETGTPPAFDHDFALARYTAAGQLDPTFGDAGLVTTGFGGAGDEANALAATADGRLVAAGVFRPQLFSYEFSFALARYLPDGRLDPTFNGECKWQ